MRESGPGSGIFKSTDGGEHWTRLTNGIPNEPLSKITAGGRAENAGAGLRVHPVGRAAARRAHQRRRRRLPIGGRRRQLAAGQPEARLAHLLHAHQSRPVERPPPVHPRSRAVAIRRRRRELGEAQHEERSLRSSWVVDRSRPIPITWSWRATRASTCRSTAASSWFQTVMPLGQFYEIDVDMQEPYRVYGGMQDTASWSGPSRTYDNDGITDHDWIKLRSVGDGMAIHPHPRDPSIVYLAQNNGNLSRLDMRTWTRTELQPDPAMAAKLGLHEFRWDWSPPFIVSSHDPNVLYVGGNYVFRCQIGGALPNGEVEHTCTVISPDSDGAAEQTVPAGRRGPSQLRRAVLARAVAGRPDGALGGRRRRSDSRVAGRRAALDARRRRLAGRFVQERVRVEDRAVAQQRGHGLRRLRPALQRRSQAVSVQDHRLRQHVDDDHQRSAVVGIDLRDPGRSAQRARALRRDRVGAVRLDRRRRPLGALEELAAAHGRALAGRSPARQGARGGHLRPVDLDRRCLGDRATRGGARAVGVPVRGEAGDRAQHPLSGTAPVSRKSTAICSSGRPTRPTARRSLTRCGSPPEATSR